MDITWKYLTGSCRTATDNKGSVLHATEYPDYGGPSFETAICGKKPGKRSNGWDVLPPYGDATKWRKCPKCARKVESP